MIKSILEMFTENDHQKAIKEMNCYFDSRRLGSELFSKGEFRNAAIHLENAARSLNELHELKKQQRGNVKGVNKIMRLLHPDNAFPVMFAAILVTLFVLLINA